MNCKLDGLVILLGTGSYSDQMAQEAGFCGEGCQTVYEETKKMEMKAAGGSV